MRKTALVTLACAAAFTLSPAFAQTRTTDDFVCELAPEKCAVVEEPAADAPAAASERGAPRASRTRGFTLARPDAPKAAPAGSPRQAGAPAAKTTKVRPVATASQTKKAVGGPGQRVDLRLAFDLGSSALTSTARAEAKVFADSLMRPELKDLKFVIEGHTDSIGGRDYNLDLSRRRAQAVADYLVSQGVSRDRLDVRGLGYDRPLPGMTAGSQENRRVEAVRAS